MSLFKKKDTRVYEKIKLKKQKGEAYPTNCNAN